MTFHLHQSYLSEVGQRISRFAAPSEVVFIQEEIAHHLEEQTFVLLDQGMTSEEAQQKAIQMLGSSEALARSIRHSFRGARWMMNGASFFAVSAVALAVPLRDLNSQGIFIQALCILFSIGAFVLALSSSGLGAKLSLIRVLITLGVSAGLFFLAPQQEQIVPAEPGSGTPTGRVILRTPLEKDVRYAASDGRILHLAKSDKSGVSVFRIEAAQGSAHADPMPDKYRRLFTMALSQDLSLEAQPKASNRDSYLVWAWVTSTILIIGGAYGAATLGERRRAALHKLQTPPPPPSPPNTLNGTASS